MRRRGALLWMAVAFIVGVSGCAEARTTSTGSTTSRQPPPPGACPEEMRRDCALFESTGATNLIDSLAPWRGVGLEADDPRRRGKGEFTVDADGTMRYEVRGRPVGNRNPEFVLNSFENSFEVERFEELPSEGDEVRYRGRCYTYEGPPPRKTIACEATVRAYEEGGETFVSATLLGWVTDEAETPWATSPP